MGLCESGICVYKYDDHFVSEEIQPYLKYDSEEIHSHTKVPSLYNLQKSLKAKIASGEHTLEDNGSDFIDAYLIKMENDRRNGTDASRMYKDDGLLYDIFDLWIAGHETTSLTLMWGFMHFIRNQEGADGAVLHSGQILQRWREYYNHLCNEEFCHPIIPTVPTVEGPVPPITAVEVSAALAKMKSNKATGPDDIPADVWKLLGNRGPVWLATLFNKIVAGGPTPDVWQTSVTVPVWKGKGDIADCTSYRLIRLLCHTKKIFERVVKARLRKIVSVSLNQCSFVKDCSTIDAIHAVRILLQKHREKNRSVHLAFFDLEKAFDRVPHELLWMSMRSHRVPEEYVRWTKLLYAKPTSVVRCATGTSRAFPAQKQHPWTLLFPDDVMLASESRGDLQKKEQSWKDRLQRHGLHLNTSKTEYMECGPRIEDGSICVDGTELNKVIKKIRREVRTITSGTRSLSLADKRNTPYLNWAILETQRLASILNLNAWRKSEYDILVGGHCVPKGTAIAAELCLIMSDEKSFTDPSRIVGNMISRYNFTEDSRAPIDMSETAPYGFMHRPKNFRITVELA
ncbi:reverse transcriptase [Necator americanus]|uniref:Reverse transcriptase n=1 Tax=Necator americanus TaxID=51031 RepID=W2SL51_NECAM|nr:reverse transcriptase [Necator americanus]ETN70394.1 reverse transcriptase [Necator americanus]